MNDSDADDRQPALRLVASPQDTNAAGDIFGGWIMAQVDVAGSIAAYRRAGGRVATVAVDSLQFHQPVLVGDLVSCYAEVMKVGTTSITVHVEVVVERDSRAGIARLKVTEANLVYVALDNDGKPRPV
ncbi:acyl-CoA hydrolase [Thiohalobacter thiocyanaticus]|uniref:Acyl-CoA hydrolase n=1 Tax=Thiohalobacter thiocyanaticus TaxID=585455 RepID=A0A1Z4VSB5_9GAMM|nr:acyl-CoA thioesterase [Thiohalobacter thiocyanaticus]BAZ94238.1 acyl-CoA hydrolase [Thiohalobacter thiocyanaticus]